MDRIVTALPVAARAAAAALQNPAEETR